MVKLTVIHETAEPDSAVLTMVSEGWPQVLSALKTLLETGARPPSRRPDTPRRQPSPLRRRDAAHRYGQRHRVPADGLVARSTGAARELTERVRRAAADGKLPLPVVLVLEGQAKAGVAEGVASGVEVVHAPGVGDDTIARLAADSGEPVVLVSADRGLAERVRRSGGEVVRPSWLLDRLPQ